MNTEAEWDKDETELVTVVWPNGETEQLLPELAEAAVKQGHVKIADDDESSS